jgi:hypothetical protein
MGETAQQHTRSPIPAVAVLREDPERIERMWAMRPAERVAAARAGRLTLGEMLRWASRRPSEVELVDGEWWFITALLADTDDEHGNLPWQQASSDTSPAAAAAASDTSSEGRRRCAC